MTRAEKFTTIYNAFKAIKTAITGKGVTVSGDISTFADAINSIPVGSEVVTGQVSGNNTKTLTITDAIGKDNIVVFLIITTSTLSTAAITGASFIDGTMRMTYRKSSDFLNVSGEASYNKTNGQIKYTGLNNYWFSSGNTYYKYVYVAW